MDNTEIKLFTVQQVSEILQISRSKAYEIFNRVDFPSFNVGRQLWVTEVALLKWLSIQPK